MKVNVRVTFLCAFEQDASLDLEADKIVTQEDALKVLHAEIRNSPSGQPQPGGVAAAIQAAADVNERAGLVEPASGAVDRAFPKEDTLSGAPDAEQAPSDAVKLPAEKDSSTEPLLPQKETPEKELAEPVPSHVKKD